MLHGEQDVDMGQVPLLKLHSQHVPLDLAQHLHLQQVVQQGVQLELEDATLQVGPVMHLLAEGQGCLDLWPGRIAGHG